MAAFTVLVLNGSNLDMLGEREPHLYGNTSLIEIQKQLEDYAGENQIDLLFFQSNHEGELIDKLHEKRNSIDLLIFNPGGFTHYSVSLRDAVLAVGKPMVEVHLSNIFAREAFRQRSMFSDIADAVIMGFREESYLLALQAGVKLVKNREI